MLTPYVGLSVYCMLTAKGEQLICTKPKYKNKPVSVSAESINLVSVKSKLVGSQTQETGGDITLDLITHQST